MTLTMPKGNLALARSLSEHGCYQKSVHVQDSLYKMPIEELDVVLDACEVPTGEYKLLLHILAHDPRMYIRKRVAEVLKYNIKPDSHEMEALIYRLICDIHKSVSDAALSGLREYIRASNPMTRTRLLCEWARSSHRCARMAVVNVLMEEISADGILSIIEHMAEDPSTTVRQDIAVCAGLYYGRAPDRMLRVLSKLKRDERYEVRSMAAGILDYLADMTDINSEYGSDPAELNPDDGENLPDIPAPKAA